MHNYDIKWWDDTATWLLSLSVPTMQQQWVLQWEKTGQWVGNTGLYLMGGGGTLSVMIKAIIEFTI